MRVWSSKMRFFSFDRYLLYEVTHWLYISKLHVFTRFPCDSTALVCLLHSLRELDSYISLLSSLICYPVFIAVMIYGLMLAVV